MDLLVFDHAVQCNDMSVCLYVYSLQVMSASDNRSLRGLVCVFASTSEQQSEDHGAAGEMI